MVVDDDVELFGFLHGEDGEVGGTGEDGVVVDHHELGMDHGLGEVHGDVGGGVDFLDGAVVEVVADVGFLGEEEGDLHATFGGGDEGGGDLFVAEVGHFDVDGLLGAFDEAKRLGFDFEDGSVGAVGVAEEVDGERWVVGDFSAGPLAEAADDGGVVEGEHVVVVAEVAVFDVDATGDEEAIVEEVVFGVGLVDPVDGDVGVGDEFVAEFVGVVVFDVGLGEGGGDEFVDDSFEGGEGAVEEGFAVHLDALEEEGADVFDDADFHAAIGGGEDGGGDFVADLVGTPDIHEDLDALLGYGNFPEDEVEGGGRGDGLRVFAAEEGEGSGVFGHGA